MDNLIEGINPLIISKITWKRGMRHGTHPSKLKYLKKKHPIGALLGFYQRGLFDSFWQPKVVIYGSDGDALKYLYCRSNDHAIRIHTELTIQLNEFLSSVRKND